jgi:hypothetical protein
LSEKKRGEGKRKLVSAYQKVFSTPEGRLVLKDLMVSNFIGVFESTFVPGDPYATSVHIGRQEAISRILFLLKVNPDQFLNIMNEEASHVETI